MTETTISRRSLFARLLAFCAWPRGSNRTSSRGGYEPGHHVVTYEYDDLGRLLSVTYEPDRPYDRVAVDDRESGL